MIKTESLSKNFYRSQISLLFITAILLWLVFDYTDLDIYLSSLFYDAQNNSWPYYLAFWTRTIGYYGIKYTLVLYGVSLLCLLLYSYKNNFWRARRKILLFLLLSMIIVPTEIALLKNTFHKSRPEQVITFGGNMPHVKLLEFLPQQPKAVNWPGGHASGGAALVSLYFAGRRKSKAWGRAGLFLGIGLSQIMGFVQVMRGQHFLSHNLWTLWFAWLTVTSLYFLMFNKNCR